MRDGRWRWTLALAALCVAGLACSVDIQTAYVRSAVLASDPEGATRTLSYAPDESFYLIVEAANVRGTADLGVTWYRVGAAADGGDEVVASQDAHTTGGTVVFDVVHPEQQWRIGPYRVELSLNGELVKTVEFRVRL